MCIPSCWTFLLGIKVWQSLLCLIICGNSKLYCAKTSNCWHYIDNVFQNFAIFGHATITTVFKRSLIQAFDAKFEFVWLWVITVKCFATQTNHSCAPEFFELPRFSSIVLLMLSAASTREICWVGWKFIRTVSTSQRVLLPFHCWSDTIIQILLG